MYYVLDVEKDAWVRCQERDVWMYDNVIDVSNSGDYTSTVKTIHPGIIAPTPPGGCTVTAFHDLCYSPMVPADANRICWIVKVPKESMGDVYAWYNAKDHLVSPGKIAFEGPCTGEHPTYYIKDQRIRLVTAEMKRANKAKKTAKSMANMRDIFYKLNGMVNLRLLEKYNTDSIRVDPNTPTSKVELSKLIEDLLLFSDDIVGKRRTNKIRNKYNKLK